MSRYWEEVRKLYAPFESGPRSPAADLYELEMPGGQYSNLFQQAKALGLASRWHEVCDAYSEVNRLFGDIIKVTPSSKVVGDMALFVVANNLTPDDVLDPQRELAFPESVVEFFEGRLGQPPGGFPPALQERVLKGRKPLTDRPGANLPPADLDAAREKAASLLGRPAGDREALSYVLYPRVFPDLAAHERTYSDTSILPTSIFFFGPDPGVEHLGRDRAGQDPDRQAARRRRAARRRQADGLLRAQRPAARGRGRRPLAGLVGPRDADGRPRRPQPGRLAPARAGRRRGGLRRRCRAQGPEAALDRGHEDGDDDLRRAAGPRRRAPRRRSATRSRPASCCSG